MRIPHREYMLFMGALAASTTPPSQIMPRRLRGVDIESEYNLIQSKQSKLPAITRAMVVHYYERKQTTQETS